MFIDESGNKWYKVGLHIHTTLSDGQKSPQEMAQIYKNAGFDAVAITDHWKYYPEGEIDGLKIISGAEYNIGSNNSIGDTMHIVGVGMKKDPVLIRGKVGRQEAINAIKECGGYAILAHPHWSLNNINDVKDLNGFSFVEIYNTVSDVGMSNRADSGCIIDLLANDGVVIPLVATDDAHYYCGEDECKSFVMVKAKSGSQEDILTALKNGDYYSSQEPNIEVIKQGNKILCKCSPCQKIAFMSNCAWANDRMVRGNDLSGAEYTLKDFEKWVRVEVTDKNGNRAWSNIIKL